jgi:hypothetical protein
MFQELNFSDPSTGTFHINEDIVHMMFKKVRHSFLITFLFVYVIVKVCMYVYIYAYNYIDVYYTHVCMKCDCMYEW